MDKLQARLDHLKDSKQRINALEFGDPVTNVCAGDGNPHRHAYFVEKKYQTRDNRWGVRHTDYYAKCTDRKGNFWNAGIEVLFPGHLDKNECSELWKPIHEMNY